MILRYKRLNEYATEPRYQTAQASGLDLHAALTSPVSIQFGDLFLVPTGIALEIPDGFEAQVRPRSGYSKRGVLVHLGTIDSDYRGEIFVTVQNLSPEFVCLQVAPGDRIAQLVVAPIVIALLVDTGDLGETKRGSDGFGSTGIGGSNG